MRLQRILTSILLVAAGPVQGSTPWWEEPVEILPETIEPQVVSNSGFDHGLAPWLPTSRSAPNPDAFTTWSVLDHADDPLSGSIQFVNLTSDAGGTLALGGDCFLFPEKPFQAIRVRLRYHVPVGSGRLWIELWTGFRGDMGETGCYGPGLWRLLGGPVGSTGGFVEYDSGWIRNFGPLGHLTIGFSPYVPLPAYVAHVDDVRIDTATIATVFEDGLESASPKFRRESTESPTPMQQASTATTWQRSPGSRTRLEI